MIVSRITVLHVEYTVVVVVRRVKGLFISGVKRCLIVVLDIFAFVGYLIVVYVVMQPATEYIAPNNVPVNWKGPRMTLSSPFLRYDPGIWMQ